MTVLFVETSGAPFTGCARELNASGASGRIVTPATALSLASLRGCRVVVLGAEDEMWDVVVAAASADPPARVIAVAEPPVEPALRRRAYGSGVWELLEIPRGVPWRTTMVLHAVRRALAVRTEPAVLLVDECSEVTEGIGTLAAGEGYQVESAATAAEALRRMAARRFALIVTEARRIGPDGQAVLRAAARLQPGVPVVVLTASLSDEVFLRSIEMGASDCIWKLAETDEILRAFKAALAAPDQPGYRRMRED